MILHNYFNSPALPTIVFNVALCISSWSSTFAFMILFKRIYPGQNFIEYVKDKVRNKLKFKIIFVAIGVQALIAVLVLLIITCKNNGMMPSFTISSLGMFIYLFLKNLFAGPLGEELGWRGFAFLIWIISWHLIELIKYYAILYLLVAIILVNMNPREVLLENFVMCK